MFKISDQLNEKWLRYIFLTKLASQLASQSGGVTAEVSRHLFQRLGILLARGNASLITTRSPQYVEAPVDGDVDIEL